MKIVRAKIILSNPSFSGLNPVETICIADAGTTYLCIPESVAFQLNLKELLKRDVTLANGQLQRFLM